jgi:hypothetical protein
MVLQDIVYSLPHIVRRQASAAINAGDAVYKGTTDWQVTKCTNVSNSGEPFVGVAMDTVAAAGWLGVAVPPSEVYMNGSGTITAGDALVTAYSGRVRNSSTGYKRQCFVGYCVKGGANTAVLVHLDTAQGLNQSNKYLWA